MMKSKLLFWVMLVGCVSIARPAGAGTWDRLFLSRFERAIYGDALAPHDEWGRMYQSSKPVREVDFERRYSVRSHYYLQGARTLENDRAYVAAVQRDLRRNGYYCGEIDGFFGPETSEAIMRLQKNHGLRVTGRIDVGVRRALWLP